MVGGKIKEARNCGYARMEELMCAVLRVLCSFDESKDVSQREQQDSVQYIQQSTLVESQPKLIEVMRKITETKKLVGQSRPL